MKYILILTLLISCSGAPVKEVIKPLEITPIETQISEVKTFYTLKSSLKSIKEAVRVADCVTKNKDFHNDIINHGEYSHYTSDNKDIVKKLLSDKKAIVSSYYKRWSKAVGYRIPGTDKIYVNTAKRLNLAARVVNLIHERLHVLGFIHKGNKKAQYNNSNSVPYAASSYSEKYVEGCLWVRT